jgi:hypothetical protein
VQLCAGEVIEVKKYRYVPYVAALFVFALVFVVAGVAVGQRIEAPMVFPGLMALATFGLAKVGLWGWRETYPFRERPTTATRIGEDLIVQAHNRSWTLPVRELELVHLPVSYVRGSVKYGTKTCFHEGVGIYHPKLGVIGCRERFALSRQPTGSQEHVTFEVEEDVFCFLLRTLLDVEASVLPPERTQ